MHNRIRPLAGALLLALFGTAALPQAESEGESSSTSEIERLVNELQDPEARAELVRQLELLLETRQTSPAPKEVTGIPDLGELLPLLGRLARDAWEEATSLDPRQVLLSSVASLFVVLLALGLRWLSLRLLRRLYGRLTRDDEEEEEAETGIVGGEREATPPEDRQIELPRTISRLVSLVIALPALALVAESWGVGPGALLRTTVGARVTEAGLSIGLILIATVVLWNAAGALVGRALRLGVRKVDRERTAKRLETLVPLLRSVLQVSIGLLAVLLVLSELGVNIAPLLAGAGIVGLAVGFGAQSLVKDLITGVMILMEDAVSVGDVVEAAGHTGIVEDVRIRVLRMRDLSGIVYVIPYSDVTAIKNYTKDFSYYLFEIGVAYREDTDEVCKVLREISDELRSDEEYGPNILEPLEIFGVDRFADSAVIIKARIMTKPLFQWFTGREFNRRMKKRFDELGIEIPFPHRTLYFGQPKEGKAPAMSLAFADGQDRDPRTMVPEAQ